MKRETNYATEVNPFDPNEGRSTKGDPMYHIETTMIVRESTPIYGGGSMGMGEMVERHLRECARNGHTVQTFAINFNEEQWGEFAQMARQS